MFRSRMLIALGVCFLAASGAWADELGYVDCSSHSEGTQVFAKPRKTPDIVAPLACGERFTVLVYGFYFSRVQTKDGQVGYIYSNLITVDNGAPRTQQVAPQTPAAPAARPAVEPFPSFQTAAEKTKIPRPVPIDAEPATTATAAPTTTAPVTTQSDAVTGQPAAVQPEVTAASAPSVAVPMASATPAGTSTSNSVPAAASVNETPAPSFATSATVSSPTSAAPAPAVTPAQQDTSVAAPPASDATPPTAAQPNASAASENVSPTPAQPDATVAQPTGGAVTQPAADPPATPAQPEPSVAQPEPPPAQPAPAPAIKPGDRTETWEKPNPSARTAPLVELFGGYAFTRVGGASNGTNLNGALGSFGWNPTSWLQVVADTSYSEQTIGTTKNVLYGNHFGPRFFRRTRFRWGITPFAEAFVGGSSEKTTISGSGGSTSTTGSALSYKVGGGIDIHPSRHWDVRLFDFDYYRTSFGSGAQQNNFWISSGVVLRLFGGRDE